MISIKVLGTGCKKCHQLEEQVKQALANEKIDADIEKISDINEMMQYDLLMPPGLVINGKVFSSGIIPKEEEIAGWLKAAQQEK